MALGVPWSRTPCPSSSKEKTGPAMAGDVKRNAAKAKPKRKLFFIELLPWGIDCTSKRVTAQTWEAFRLLALEKRTGAAVAAKLGMKIAAAFVAKNRVQRMLQEIIQQMEFGESSWMFYSRFSDLPGKH